MDEKLEGLWHILQICAQIHYGDQKYPSEESPRPWRNSCTFTPEDTYNCAHGSTAHNSKNLEAIQIPTNKKLETIQIPIHRCKNIFFTKLNIYSSEVSELQSQKIRKVNQKN